MRLTHTSQRNISKVALKMREILLYVHVAEENTLDDGDFGCLYMSACSFLDPEGTKSTRKIGEKYAKNDVKKCSAVKFTQNTKYNM